MNLGLVITTCKHYYKNIPKLIRELEFCNFPKENIIIVSGQETENKVFYEKNIRVVTVMYTGLHLTGLIHIYENQKLYENINYWIFLPDTVELGPTFYYKILEFYTNYISKQLIYSIPFINPKFRQTMDMGIVHIKQIQNMGNYLEKIKRNFPYSSQDVINLKKQVTKFKYNDPLFKPPVFFCVIKVI
jgi:hypothetical protein